MGCEQEQRGGEGGGEEVAREVESGRGGASAIPPFQGHGYQMGGTGAKVGLKSKWDSRTQARRRRTSLAAEASVHSPLPDTSEVRPKLVEGNFVS